MTLSAPFPYYGGKSRWAKEIWKRLGNPDTYAEPFAGSLAVLLSRDKPCRREVVGDLDGNVVNFWRAIRADPEAVAYHADYPSFHHDLTARHNWIQQTREDRQAILKADPDWYDARAAGWWAWGVSNWIGGGFGTDSALRNGGRQKDKRMSVSPLLGKGRGVQADRENVPLEASDKIPLVHDPPGTGRGVQASRIEVPLEASDKLPMINNGIGGRGVQVQASKNVLQAQSENIPEASDKRPIVTGRSPGKGVQVQRENVPFDSSDSIPYNLRGRGVSAQREDIPLDDSRDQRPYLQRGIGVIAQRENIPFDEVAINKVPMINSPPGSGQGVQVDRTNVPLDVRDQRPLLTDPPGTGQGVQVSKQNVQVHETLPGIAGAIGTGDRLIPWFQALANRLSKVYVLARSWESCVTRAVLSDYDEHGNLVIAVFLDPPYVVEDRQSTLYGSDSEGTSTDTATESYEWAVENGGRYRIAYAMHEGDFPVPPGWSSSIRDFSSGRSGAVDQVIFSPACVDEEVQQRLF